MLREKVQAKAVCFEPNGVCDVAVHGVAFTALNLLLPAQNVASDNLPEGFSELSYAVSIDEGVDHRVAVRQDDGYVHDPTWSVLALGAEESKAVDNV